MLKSFFRDSGSKSENCYLSNLRLASHKAQQKVPRFGVSCWHKSPWFRSCRNFILKNIEHIFISQMVLGKISISWLLRPFLSRHASISKFGSGQLMNAHFSSQREMSFLQRFVPKSDKKCWNFTGWCATVEITLI